jgi:flavin-dependent dehydrogenase
VATRLARAGHAVVLCDAARFPRHKVCGEYVPPAAARHFADLEVLEEVQRLGPRRHVGMAVIAPGGAKVLGRYGEGTPPGLALRRYDLDRVLLRNAGRAGVAVREGCRALGLERGPVQAFVLHLGPAGTVRARAVVGADGRNSFIARRLGLSRAAPRHRRWALMGHFLGVETPEDHGEMIVTPYGYCGINPLPGGIANVCVVLDPRRGGGAMPGKARLGAFFRALIDSHPLTRRRMARSSLAEGLWAVGPMACRPAGSVADGALLVGDAAGFYDPFTGEGIAMALRGAELAAKTLDRALRAGDLSRRALAGYERERRAAFAARLRLDWILQAILPRPRLADWVAARLARDQGLADLLARATGEVTEAAQLLRAGVLARLLAA